MGSDNSRQFFPVEFMQRVDDDRFGQVEIYRSEQNTYLMKYVKTFIVNDARFAQFQLQFNSQKMLKDQRAIIPILAYQQTRMKNLCIDYQLCTFYCEYFNFTLEDLVRSAKLVDDSELWLCLKQLLRLSRQLASNGFAAKIQLQTIFITLKGLPAIYTFLTPMKSLCKSKLSTVQENSGGFQEDINTIRQIAEVILKLGTMQLNITAGKIQCFAKEHPKLSKMIDSLLLTNSISFAEVQSRIEKMERLKQIRVASQIKLNKFRYAIPQQGIKSRQTSNKQSAQQDIHDIRGFSSTGQNQTLKEYDMNSKNIELEKKKQLLSKKSVDYTFKSQRKERQSKIVKIARTHTQTPQKQTKSIQNNGISSFVPMQNSTKKDIAKPKDLNEQILIKKNMHQQSKQKLMKRKKQMQETSRTRQTKDVQSKLNLCDLKQNMSLKESKINFSKGFSWSKKVMTSHFDDPIIFQRKLKIRN